MDRKAAADATLERLNADVQERGFSVTDLRIDSLRFDTYTIRRINRALNSGSVCAVPCQRFRSAIAKS